MSYHYITSQFHKILSGGFSVDQVVDITPSPRVLRMLGQIDFKPWQCLAELIDNSIDSFIDQMRSGMPNPNPRITIELPNDGLLANGNAQITIKDNGTGMTLEQLQKAVRAGYSGNDPVEKMGLFGMGFNISTARLGRRTEVWTTTTDSEKWIGITIDFDELERKDAFAIPVTFRNKTDHELETSFHGTEIKVSKLEPERLRPLIWGAGKSNTKKKLGKIYGRIMNSLNISIIYSGDVIKPWSHCVWGSNRFVTTAKFGNVYARIDIDRELPARKFCRTCWVWLNPGEQSCPVCGMGEQVFDRQRHVKGWIGIQRYFDQEHYGIDLIRNGRVIQELDKSFFWYEDSNGYKELEYPIDMTYWGGRIVGEIEIDFVRVSHQKDSFDKLDPEWKHVVETIRGKSPLRPQIAQRLNLEVNESPLARLFAGYRSGHAGLKNLVPGDSEGKGLNSGLVMDYKDRFYEGIEEFLSDEKLYALVLQAEEANRGGSHGGQVAGGEPPIAEPEFPTAVEPPTIPPHQPEQEILFENDINLSKNYELTIGDVPISIIAAVKRNLSKDASTPFQVNVGRGFTFSFTYSPNHTFFEESLDDPVDVFLTELSYRFLTSSGQSALIWPVSVIERSLREKYFPEKTNTISSVGATATSLLKELRVHIDEELPTKSPIDSSLIDDEILDKIQRKILQTGIGDQAVVEQAVRMGQFVSYVDDRYLLQIITIWPELVMDGAFFENAYSNIPADLKDEALRRVIFGLEDLLWISEDGRNAISRDLTWRLRFARALASTNLLLSWRAD